MGWLLVGMGVWASGACSLALLIGRSIRLADGIESASSAPPLPDSARAG